MKLRYSSPKHRRVKSFNFCWVQLRSKPNENYWCDDKDGKWYDLESDHTIRKCVSNSSTESVRSVKAFRRYVRKHATYLPKGTVLVLASRFSDNDVEATTY